MILPTQSTTKSGSGASREIPESEGRKSPDFLVP